MGSGCPGDRVMLREPAGRPRTGTGQGPFTRWIARDGGRKLHDLKVALVFLTHLPVRLRGEVAMHDLAGAVHFFPAVGALVAIGLLTRAVAVPIIGFLLVAIVDATHQFRRDRIGPSRRKQDSRSEPGPPQAPRPLP